MTLYLDMDGVLADFFTAFAEYFGQSHWKEIPDKEKSILELQKTNFFYRLDEFDSAKELIDFAKSTGDWGICSSPLRGDRDNSAYWKRRWLEDRGWVPEIEKLIFTGQKENYAVDDLDGTPNILVDDKPSNIKAWEAKGGIGFLYQANENDIKKLLKKLKKVLQMP
jgi:hypothetical protein